MDYGNAIWLVSGGRGRPRRAGRGRNSVIGGFLEPYDRLPLIKPKNIVTELFKHIPPQEEATCKLFGNSALHETDKHLADTRILLGSHRHRTGHSQCQSIQASIPRTQYVIKISLNVPGPIESTFSSSAVR